MVRRYAGRLVAPDAVVREIEAAQAWGFPDAEQLADRDVLPGRFDLGIEQASQLAVDSVEPPAAEQAVRQALADDLAAAGGQGAEAAREHPGAARAEQWEHPEKQLPQEVAQGVAVAAGELPALQEIQIRKALAAAGANEARQESTAASIETRPVEQYLEAKVAGAPKGLAQVEAAVVPDELEQHRASQSAELLGDHLQIAAAVLATRASPVEKPDRMLQPGLVARRVFLFFPPVLVASQRPELVFPEARGPEACRHPQLFHFPEI